MGVGVFSESFDSYGETFIADTMGFFSNENHKSNLIESFDDDFMQDLHENVADFVKQVLKDSLSDDYKGVVDGCIRLMARGKDYQREAADAMNEGRDEDEAAQSDLREEIQDIVNNELGGAVTAVSFTEDPRSAMVLMDFKSRACNSFTNKWRMPIPDESELETLRDMPDKFAWDQRQQDLWEWFNATLVETAQSMGGSALENAQWEKDMEPVAELGGPTNNITVYAKQWEGSHWVVGVAACKHVREALKDCDEDDPELRANFMAQWDIPLNDMKSSIEEGVTLASAHLRVLLHQSGFDIHYKTSGHSTASYDLPERGSDELNALVESTRQVLMDWNNAYKDKFNNPDLMREEAHWILKDLELLDTYVYHVNLDERGEFSADVRHILTDETVFAETMRDIVDGGFMSHSRDIGGLLQHLVKTKVIPESSSMLDDSERFSLLERSEYNAGGWHVIKRLIDLAYPKEAAMPKP